MIIAVTCTDPAGTCFCVSMDTGPVPRRGYDLALTELYADGPHRFVAEAGTPRGEELLAGVGAPEATAADLDSARRVGEEAAGRMGRHLETTGLKDLLYASVDSPVWDEVATRCLSCTNCTLVCPTCFCTSVEDVSDLTGTSGERHRVWDSCFSEDYSYIHGGAVRQSTSARYRQWMTHKLASWQDQFGMSGCVGCGRCVTWCPAGIDITAEAAVLRRDADHREERSTATIMTIRDLEQTLPDHPFFEGFDHDMIALLAGCAHNVHLRPDELVFQEGQRADAFYLVRHGRIAIELHRTGRRAPHPRHGRGGRGAGLLVADPALPLVLRRPRHRGHPGGELRRHLPARQVRRGPGRRLRPDVDGSPG